MWVKRPYFWIAAAAVVSLVAGYLAGIAVHSARPQEPAEIMEEMYRYGGDAHKAYEDSLHENEGKFPSVPWYDKEAWSITLEYHGKTLDSTEEFEVEMMRLHPADESLIALVKARQAERTAVAAMGIRDFFNSPAVVDVQVATVAPSTSFIATPTTSASFVVTATPSTTIADAVPSDLIDGTSPTVIAYPPTVTPSSLATFLEDAASLNLTIITDVLSDAHTPSPSTDPSKIISAKGVVFDCWRLREWYDEEKSYSHLSYEMTYYFDEGEHHADFDEREAEIALNECGWPLR